MNYDPKTTDTRVCSRCNEEQHLGQFVNKNPSKVGGWQSRAVCKRCKSEQGKAKKHEYYKNNKDVIIARSRAFSDAARKRNYKFINRVKQAAICRDCKINYPHYILQFDHVVKDKKNMYIAQLVCETTSLKRIKDEIRKCEIVCANCHKMRTQKRRWEGTHLVFGKQYSG